MATSVIGLPRASGAFKTTDLSGSYTLAGTSSTTVTVSGTAAGWTPIAVTGYRSGSNHVRLWKTNPTFEKGSASVAVGIRNISSSSQNSTIHVYVLWVR